MMQMTHHPAHLLGVDIIQVILHELDTTGKIRLVELVWNVPAQRTKLATFLEFSKQPSCKLKLVHVKTSRLINANICSVFICGSQYTEQHATQTVIQGRYKNQTLKSPCCGEAIGSSRNLSQSNCIHIFLKEQFLTTGNQRNFVF